MITNQYHILNGDALKRQFPSWIKGEIIVARECLVDGNVEGEDLDKLFQTRAIFISNYDGYSEADYYQKTVPEFEKMLAIPGGSEINLWFEDDLFCQVNFWFVVYLLSTSKNSLYLVRPESHSPYGFGGLNKAELISCHEQRIPISEVGEFAKLWKYYQTGDNNALLKVGTLLQTSYPFLMPAIEAHIARIPSKNSLGRPVESLISIMQHLETKDFDLVFKEFCKTESIYGFGDLQVKRMFDELMKR